MDNEDGRRFFQVRQCNVLPFGHRMGLDIFVGARDAGSDTQPGLRSARLQQIIHHPGVAVRCFNEKLRLIFGVGAAFQSFDGCGACTSAYWQITVEGETLTVEP